jgi:CHAD domain-containing protein
MRSIFLLLERYFKSKSVDTYRRRLRKVAQALGDVRDLDVMIDDLKQYQATLPEDQQAGLQGLIDSLNEERTVERKHLNKALSKGDYKEFVKEFSEFLSKPGAGAKHINSGAPTLVRQVLPVEIYGHLATIRTYEGRLEDANNETLHQLRIEFKGLRYLVSMFAEVMGKPGKEFIAELKAVQDHLGRLNDKAVAQARLKDLLPTLDDAEAEIVKAYIERLAQEEAVLKGQFPEVWRHFNSKMVQRQLATAVGGL